VTEVEAEWDDRQRALALELESYEAGVCSGCGFHHSVAVKDNDFGGSFPTCYVCAESERAQRIQQAADDAERKRLWGDDPPHDRRDPADGQRFRVVLRALRKILPG